MDARLIADKERQNQLEQKFRGNPAFFIPITELPHFMKGLSDQQKSDLNRAIEILTKDEQPENKVFFLGELALMQSPLYAPHGLFEATINPLNKEAAPTEPKYNIPRSALDLINNFIKENNFKYGESKNHSTPSIEPPEGNRLKLEFKLSAEQGEFFKDAEQVATLAKHADNPVKLLITKAFLRAIQSEIPTNDMHKECFINTNIPPIEFKEKDGILTVHMELPALFAGLVKDNIDRHPEKFEATQADIGKEIALAISIQQNVQTLQIAA